MITLVMPESARTVVATASNITIAAIIDNRRVGIVSPFAFRSAAIDVTLLGKIEGIDPNCEFIDTGGTEPLTNFLIARQFLSHCDALFYPLIK